MLADQRGSGNTTYTEQLRVFAAAVADAGDQSRRWPRTRFTTMRLIDDAYRAACSPGAPDPMTPIR